MGRCLRSATSMPRHTAWRLERMISTGKTPTLWLRAILSGSGDLPLCVRDIITERGFLPPRWAIRWWQAAWHCEVPTKGLVGLMKESLSVRRVLFAVALAVVCVLGT